MGWYRLWKNGGGIRLVERWKDSRTHHLVGSLSFYASELVMYVEKRNSHPTNDLVGFKL